MLFEQTMEKLYAMKLNGMAQAMEDQRQQADVGDLAFEERFGLLVDRQWTWREDRALSRRLGNAKLPQPACVEDIDFRHPRGLDRSQVRGLATCDWIAQHHNLIVTGPTGCGKTYLGCALAHQACRQGYTAHYLRTPRLFQTLAIAHADGSWGRLLTKLAKFNLLVIDDWGLATLDEMERRDLLEIIEDRHRTQSTLVCAQLPIPAWHGMIGDSTIADAILDRLVHTAVKIELKGESLRKAQASQKKKTP
jgi:DNA replication protein DnaC